MLSIKARNVNDALPLAMMHLRNAGEPRNCRPNIGGSSVIEYPGPVATTYARPRERVLWHPARDANPFFHFFEALWILDGRSDVRFLQQFNKRIAEVSDDGTTFHGAYGERMRQGHGFDQIEGVVTLLRASPESRRAVLQIWNPEEDLAYPGNQSKDIPCNDMVMLKVRDNALHITVANRSNDIVWGCYGANVVQFSMLQEYIAARLGVAVGQYTQVSDSFHVYESNPFWQRYMREAQDGDFGWFGNDPYTNMTEAAPYPLFSEPEFDYDMRAFFGAYDNPGKMFDFKTKAFNTVVMPMYKAHEDYRAGRYQSALEWLGVCMPCDWRLAAGMWIMRRVEAKRADAPRIIVPGAAA